jgi:tRNA nucleotidyltransferase (CCA-adding enzyme)
VRWNEFFPHFLKLSETFLARGVELFLVGGCVRDHLLNLEPKDYDLNTSARPELTKEILEGLPIVTTIWPLGEKFGTIAAKLDNGQQIEITTFRKDLSPGRHPDVAFTTDLTTDLERRDLTINSMACGSDGMIIDPFGGQKDLEARRIACTGDAFARFSEDPLRMLRAIRFVSKFGFTLDARTALAIKELGNSILMVSRERWLEEMDKLLVGPYVESGLQWLAQSRLLWFLLPEMLITWERSLKDQKDIKNLWGHIKLVVSKVPARADIRWAALLHDIAKPQTMGYKGGKIHFLGHEALGAEIVTGIARRFKMSNEKRRSVRGLVFLHQRVSAAMEEDKQVNMRVLRRLARECKERSCRIEDLIDLFGADCSSVKESKRNMVAEQRAALVLALGQMREEDLRPKLPAGIGDAIMIKYGLKPGPEVGVLRQKLDKMLIDGEIETNDSIESMLEKLGPIGG